MPTRSGPSNWTRAAALTVVLACANPFVSGAPALAQGVPVVDTQNIAQNIQQLRQMIEDEILQNEQLTQLRAQLTTLTDQLAELQRTYEALTRIADLPEIIQTRMEDELNGLLDQEFGDIQATIRAIRAGDFSGLMHLTATGDGYLGERCPRLPVSPRDELQARFDFCHEKIPWDEVAEAQVFAGKPTGSPAAGCDDGVEDYGRLQLFLHMNDKTIWRVEFYGAVGENGNAIGINGEVACSEVDEAPELK